MRWKLRPLLLSLALGAGVMATGCKDDKKPGNNPDMTSQNDGGGSVDMTGADMTGAEVDMTGVPADMTVLSQTWAEYVRNLIDTQTTATALPDDVVTRTFSDDPNATPQSAFSVYFP